MQKTNGRVIFYFMSLAVLLGLVGWLAPRAIGLYYQSIGGRILDEETRSAGMQGRPDEIAEATACERDTNLDELNQARLVQAIRNLQKAIHFSPGASHSYLLLGQVYCLSGQPKNAVQAFLKYTKLRPDNPLGHLRLGFAYEAKDKTSTAAEEWRIAGVTAEDFSKEADRAAETGERLTALAWYKRALSLNTDDNITRLKVVRLCQDKYLVNLELCSEYPSEDFGNLFIDPDFASKYMFTYWKPYEYITSTAYSIIECPDIPIRKCAHIVLSDSVTGNGAGLYQCLPLHEGKNYVYSAWLRVQAEENGTWRPLYIQGMTNGQASADWLRLEKKEDAVVWKYFENTFTAPQFDNQFVCLHPVRLESKGEVWIYQPRLQRIDE